VKYPNRTFTFKVAVKLLLTKEHNSSIMGTLKEHNRWKFGEFLKDRRHWFMKNALYVLRVPKSTSQKISNSAKKSSP